MTYVRRLEGVEGEVEGGSLTTLLSDAEIPMVASIIGDSTMAMIAIQDRLRPHAYQAAIAAIVRNIYYRNLTTYEISVTASNS
jgi:hypothetical protein